MLTVAPEWPSDDLDFSGAEIRVEDMNTGSRYVSAVGTDGLAAFSLPNGLYRVNMSGRL